MKGIHLRPRAVLFYWDNTLVASWALIGHAMNETLKAFGQKPWDSEETERRVRNSARESFPLLFGDRWEEAVRIYTDVYTDRHLDEQQPLEGAEDLLRTLSGLGIYIGIVSNKRGHFLRAEAEKLAWSRYIGALVGAGDAPSDKPAPDHALAALSPSGSLDCSNVWFIGDTDIDLQCAINIKAVPILQRPVAPSPSEFRDCPPRLHFLNCQETLKYLVSLPV